MVKVYRITEYIRKRDGKLYHEYRMTAPPGDVALLMKVTGDWLKNKYKLAFDSIYILLINPDEKTIELLKRLEKSNPDARLVFFSNKKQDEGEENNEHSERVDGADN